MKMLLGALSLGALLVGYSTVTLACNGSCDLKPETPASFDVACMTNDCRSDTNTDQGNGQLKPELPFEVPCYKSCDRDGKDRTGQPHRPELPEKPFRMACGTSDC